MYKIELYDNDLIWWSNFIDHCNTIHKPRIHINDLIILLKENNAFLCYADGTPDNTNNPFKPNGGIMFDTAEDATAFILKWS